MKVILQRDLPKVGTTGEIVSVKDGFARNYLFPRQYAVAAKGGALKDHEARILREKERDSRKLTTAQTEAEALKDTQIVLVRKVGRGTKLFGSITAQDVVDLLAQQANVAVDRRRIGLADPIKSLGTYTVPVRLHSDISVSIGLEVISEEEDARRKVEAERAAAQAAAQAEAASVEPEAEEPAAPAAEEPASPKAEEPAPAADEDATSGQ